MNVEEVERALARSAIPVHSGVVADALGASVQEVEEALGQLEHSGRVHREGARWAANAILGYSA